MSISAKIYLSQLLNVYNNTKKNIDPASEIQMEMSDLKINKKNKIMSYSPMMSRGFRKSWDYLNKLRNNLFINNDDLNWIEDEFKKNVRIKNFGVYKAYYKFKNLVKKESINDTTILGEEFSDFKQSEILKLSTDNYNKVFTFTIKTLVNIIETSLVSVREGCFVTPEPKKPLNPYNRKPFKYFDYLKIWMKFKSLNMKSLIFQLFKQANFNIILFKTMNNALLFNINIEKYFSTVDEEEYKEMYFETLEFCKSIYDREYPERPSNRHFNKWTICEACIDDFDITRFRKLIKNHWLLSQGIISQEVFVNWMKIFFSCNSNFLTEKKQGYLCTYHNHYEETEKIDFLSYYKYQKPLKIDYTKSRKYKDGIYNFTANPWLVFITDTKEIDLRDKWTKYQPEYLKYVEQFKSMRDYLCDKLHDGEKPVENYYSKLNSFISENADFFDKKQKIDKMSDYLNYLCSRKVMSCHNKKFKNSEFSKVQDMLLEMMDCVSECLDCIKTIKSIIVKKFKYILDDKNKLQEVPMPEAEDISLVVNETDSTYEEAENALIENDGDIVNAIMDLLM